MDLRLNRPDPFVALKVALIYRILVNGYFLIHLSDSAYTAPMPKTEWLNQAR